MRHIGRESSLVTAISEPLQSKIVFGGGISWKKRDQLPTKKIELKVASKSGLCCLGAYLGMFCIIFLIKIELIRSNVD